MFNKKTDNIAKKTGLARDQEGIIQRYFREKQNWDIHLRNTRDFILQHTAERTGTVIVLGSGWLLDVPVKELTQRFDRVYLADIRHPIQVQKKMQSFPQVELLTVDLTGGLLNFAQSHKKKQSSSKDYIEHHRPPGLPDEIDCYISCNILNQLDILLWETAKKSISDKEFIQVRSYIQQQHLAQLQAKKSCLIADIQQTAIDLNKPNCSTTSSSLYTSLPSTPKKQEWEWIFDTQGRYLPGKEVRFLVQAISF